MYEMAATAARILVIEDNDALRVMLFTVLRHQPLAVDTASSADEAMDKVRTCDYALILLDLNLPDDESAEFLRRSCEFRPESKTFVLAARDPLFVRRYAPHTVNAIVDKTLEVDTPADGLREYTTLI